MPRPQRKLKAISLLGAALLLHGAATDRPTNSRINPLVFARRIRLKRTGGGGGGHGGGGHHHGGGHHATTYGSINGGVGSGYVGTSSTNRRNTLDW